MKIAFTVAVLLLALIATPVAAQANRHVTLTAKPMPTMKPGATVQLALLFQTKKGIHINLDPEIEITAEKNPITTLVGNIHASKDARGYLDPSQLVRVDITASADAPKGKRTLKLTVVYFLCSDAEGWCNRDEQVIDVPVTVK